MNETDLTHSCGCCEGVEELTPLLVANRPGLDALVYRVGTHSSFLETMIARLSNLALEMPAADGSEETETIYPLQSLTTRQRSDPAMALLDGWATVADVLTFYQERIANEGYLRTATERRSILELARLVGYRLRPGVAASTYLAFTLDSGYQVTIPMSSRSQSIPGPGELPQFFETAEPLPARAEWNELKPRQTRPHKLRLPRPGRVSFMEDNTLYFAGIATNLKAGDPLLFVFGLGTEEQVLRQVESVTVQAAEDRTQVVLQSLWPGRGSGTAVAPDMQPFLDHYLNLAAFTVSPARAMTGRVVDILQTLATELQTQTSARHMRLTFNQTLAALKREQAIAEEGHYRWLRKWVGEIVTELTAIRSAMSWGRGTDTAEERPGAANGETSPLTHLAPYLSAAAKPASLQPANRLQLPRDARQTYAATADIAPRLLAALRPELAPVLYQTWRELPLTPGVSAKVLALRTRASVFGHNAPASESFAIRLRLERPADQRNQNIRLIFEMGDHSLMFPPVEEPPLPIEDRELDIPFPAANETIHVTLSVGDSERERLPIAMRFRFAHRPMVVDGRIDTQGRFHVTSSGSNPVTLRFNSASNEPEVGIRGANNSPEISIHGELNTQANVSTEVADVVWLDTTYGQIVPGSWVALVRPSAFGDPGDENHIPQTVVAQVTAVSEQSRADYGLPGLKSTRLTLDRPWLNPAQDGFGVIRGTAVFAQSEPLTLAEAPIDPIAEAICGNEIELDGLYDGLEAGRWLIISGERTDVKPEEPETASTRDGDEETAAHLPGIPATELVMLAGVEQDYTPTLPGETTHTRLQLANDLAYCYKRDTVTIYGNVAKATHGETRQEVLGSGDGSKPFQRFTLKQPPVTFVSAPTANGVESSLVVRVNDIKWHEAAHLVGLAAADRVFTTQTDDEEKMMVIFGDGRYGTRLPTGVENVKAVYRNGIGKMGNVSAGQISLLVTRPLGVKGVINPLPATGGADCDSRDQARRNAPIAVIALDRLVSVADYADFARTFAGIGKASAVRLADGRRQVVHLTIAGAGDIPIDKNSDLYRNLSQAVRQFGDPYQPVQIDIYGRKLLIISGKVRVLPDYLWEAVAPQIRARLLDTFSFDRRHLGQDVVLSEVISAIQAIPGVAYVDVDILDAIAGDASLEELTNLAHTLTLRPRIVADMAHINPTATDPDEHIQPAELVYLSPDVPDTLILTELSHD
ncbi:MAG TPA: putative baseplate assembly protein [Chloroflexota bacterium]|nr:putative baseplate assembly protein [Chloroflexota bacterium]